MEMACANRKFHKLCNLPHANTKELMNEELDWFTIGVVVEQATKEGKAGPFGLWTIADLNSHSIKVYGYLCNVL